MTKLQKQLQKNKAVVAVDLGGIICDYDKLYAAIESKKDLFKAKEGDSSEHESSRQSVV